MTRSRGPAVQAEPLIREPVLLEDAVATRPDEKAEDDQDDPPQDLPRNKEMMPAMPMTTASNHIRNIVSLHSHARRGGAS